MDIGGRLLHRMNKISAGLLKAAVLVGSLMATAPVLKSQSNAEQQENNEEKQRDFIELKTKGEKVEPPCAALNHTVLLPPIGKFEEVEKIEICYVTEKLKYNKEKAIPFYSNYSELGIYNYDVPAFDLLDGHLMVFKYASYAPRGPPTGMEIKFYEFGLKREEYFKGLRNRHVKCASFLFEPSERRVYIYMVFYSPAKRRDYAIIATYTKDRVREVIRRSLIMLDVAVEAKVAIISPPPGGGFLVLGDSHITGLRPVVGEDGGALFTSYKHILRENNLDWDLCILENVKGKYNPETKQIEITADNLKDPQTGKKYKIVGDAKNFFSELDINYLKVVPDE